MPDPNVRLTDVSAGRDIVVAVSAAPRNPRVHVIWASAVAVSVFLVCGTLVALRLIDLATAVLVTSGAIGAAAAGATLGTKVGAKLGATTSGTNTAAVGGTLLLTAIVPTVLTLQAQETNTAGLPNFAEDPSAARYGVTPRELQVLHHLTFSVAEHSVPSPEPSPARRLKNRSGDGYGYAFDVDGPSNQLLEEEAGSQANRLTAVALNSAEPPENYVRSTPPDGRLPPETIRRILRFSYPSFKQCILPAIQHLDTHLRLLIHDSGRVIEARVEAATTAPAPAATAFTQKALHATTTCISTKALALSFPEPGSLVVVEQPWSYDVNLE